MAGILTRSLRKTLSLRAPIRAIHAPSAGEHSGGYKLWKNLSIFVAVPCVGLCMVNVYLHLQQGGHERPEFVPYDHMRIRNRRFPWGDGQKSFFHNPHVNALPDGYEEDDHH